MNKQSKKLIIIDIAILVIVAIVLAVSMVWSTDIELKLGLLYYTDEPVDESEIVVIESKNGVHVSATDGSGELNVHFVDVGQGDCTVIEFPDGKTMVIDGGENNKKTETAIQTFIDKTLPKDFTYFDYAILTHPDSDHCGSFDYVLTNYPAKEVYRPNVEAIGTDKNPYVDPGKTDLTSDARTKDTAAYAAAVKAMYAETEDFTSTVKITDPATCDTITDGTYTFDFYSPFSTKYTGEGEWNNYSPIMILEYKGFKYAMSGDAEEKNLEQFVEKIESAKTDGVTDKYDAFTDSYCVNVIKAGHHGSRNATTLDYLQAITTDAGAKGVYCVISCGEGNSYKHPHQEALDRYLAIGVPESNILRTDLVGDITLSVRTDENGEYKLFYGESASGAPIEPNDPEDPWICEYPTVLVYRKIGSVKLKWPLVAWVCYAVLVVVAIVHIVYVTHGGDKPSAPQGKGKGTRK
ncbi:MAG: MBL fold metallo-hydrolase [Clostridiales bacterium]|nr:MBL fold metallo-hydrolase [Clostridiales bacterium]